MKIFNIAVLAACSLALTAPLIPTLAQAPPPGAPMGGPMGGPMHGPMGGPMHGPMGGMRGGGHMRAMADELGLSDAQKAKMQPIIMGARQQMMALRASTTLSPTAQMAKMQSIRKASTAQMMAILTPAQRTKLKAMTEARRQARNGGQ